MQPVLLLPDPGPKFRRKRIKVTLVAASQVSFHYPIALYQCTGILILASCLRERNIDCDVVDLEEYNNLSLVNFNNIIDSAVGNIIDSKPTVVGLSTKAVNLPVALEILKNLKEKKPAIITVLGGTGVAFCAKEIIASFPEVDVVVRGEAENAFTEFIESLKSKKDYSAIKGLVFRDGEQIIDNGWTQPIEDLDTLPMPAYDLCRYHDSPGKYHGVVLEAGRGCYLDCAYCNTQNFFYKKHRLKSIERVIKEIRYIRDNIGDIKILISNDLVTGNHKYISGLCAAINEQIPSLQWDCGAHYECLTPEIAETIQKAGCEAVYLSVDTMSDMLTTVVNGQADFSGFHSIMEKMVAQGLEVNLCFILGFPEEEEYSIEALFTYSFRAKYQFPSRVHLEYFALVPYAGTIISQKWKNKLAYDDYGNPGSTFVPLEWNKLNEKIKLHPEIFSPYYHIHTTEEHRTNTLKYALMDFVVEGALKYSMHLAYLILEDALAQGIIANSNKIRLPSPEAYKKDEYLGFLDSIGNVISGLIEKNIVLQKKLEALLRFEIVTYRAYHAENQYSEVIEACYNPMDIITGLSNNSIIEDENNTLRYFMVMVDKTRDLKITEIPATLASLYKNQN
ncbi:MAG: B12-binding domain-containing radical SAM protein [bacterium]|nr:B12-binding domain-containing radical SAM protein [bacterium]